ncbi:hypothetical protein [Phenylobacterium hankyongense]|uniref:hypothetical protein n=1 Tax=Phenylobacterium hankyongense TaxID=1813876 RepID=UPI001A9E216F|nr:hypothetical protein [Phenylobacterium hankyongense]
MSEPALASSLRTPHPEREAGGPLRVPRRRGSWLSDFRFAKGRVEVFDTGADLVLDRTLVGEALVWFGYHLVVRARSWTMRLLRRDAPRVWFAPHTPRPWYLVWAAMAWAGVRIASSPDKADAAFAFEDATWSERQVPPLLPAFNFRCPDISKSRVAAVFEAVFGYPLAVDPATWSGEAVEKSELNGAHDGRIVSCPTARRAGQHYQRLIDTTDDACAYDLRTACVGGAPVAVWIKRKPSDNRFSIHNLSVTLQTPAEVFSPEEIARITRFLAAMHIDWAGLDILRDRHSGRIYIVDVNKTDVGPIIALSFADKIRSTVRLARALDALLPARAKAPARRRPQRAGPPTRLSPPAPL